MASNGNSGSDIDIFVDPNAKRTYKAAVASKTTKRKPLKVSRRRGCNKLLRPKGSPAVQNKSKPNFSARPKATPRHKTRSLIRDTSSDSDVSMNINSSSSGSPTIISNNVRSQLPIRPPRGSPIQTRGISSDATTQSDVSVAPDFDVPSGNQSPPCAQPAKSRYPKGKGKKQSSTPMINLVDDEKEKEEKGRDEEKSLTSETGMRPPPTVPPPPPPSAIPSTAPTTTHSAKPTVSPAAGAAFRPPRNTPTQPPSATPPTMRKYEGAVLRAKERARDHPNAEEDKKEDPVINVAWVNAGGVMLNENGQPVSELFNGSMQASSISAIGCRAIIDCWELGGPRSFMNTQLLATLLEYGNPVSGRTNCFSRQVYDRFMTVHGKIMEANERERTGKVLDWRDNKSEFIEEDHWYKESVTFRASRRVTPFAGVKRTVPLNQAPILARLCDDMRATAIGDYNAVLMTTVIACDWYTGRCPQDLWDHLTLWANALRGKLSLDPKVFVVCVMPLIHPAKATTKFRRDVSLAKVEAATDCALLFITHDSARIKLRVSTVTLGGSKVIWGTMFMFAKRKQTAEWGRIVNRPHAMAG